MWTRLVVLAVATALVTGCSGGEPASTTSAMTPSLESVEDPESQPLPELDGELVAIGADLYSQFCSSCHGANLEGAADWQVMNADGSFPPPPQDSSGHTWHHGDDLLLGIVLDGSDFAQSRMPAFVDLLSGDDVLSILEFFKSKWGPQERAVQWEMTLRERGRA